MFKDKLPVVPDFSALEREILRWWGENGVVEKYLRKNEKSHKRFSFLDGPITANNPMGVHHAHGRTLKDFFQRYKNMQGFRQRFQNGFDCQGLWVEVEEEKEKGFNSKKEIEAYGIERFCRDCKARVEKFAKVQTEQSKRLGMFMDWGNDYYTMSEANNEYIWHFLKKVHEKGWLYKGVDVMPWCIRCGTAISQHELSDEGYREILHPSIYVKFPIKRARGQEGKRARGQDCLLVWTTTPWTLPANVAVAVSPTATYVKVKIPRKDHFNNIYHYSMILAKERVKTVLGAENLKEGQTIYQIERELSGKDLVGLEYEGPFDEYEAQKGISHRVVGADFVSLEEGTGLVHVAPGAGKEDFGLGKKENLAVISPLDGSGNYIEGFGELSGMNVREVDGWIFGDLQKKGLLYKHEEVKHSYPHCWRCKEPLVFRTTTEWFIKVDEIRPKLKEEAGKVNWMPKFAEKRMQDWLTQMSDWPISRKRYWGLALPIYECLECGKVTVVESRQELHLLATDPQKVERLPELHRPWIDEIKIRCPGCRAEVSRIPEVGDCWLDAGIVPFSTIKYLDDPQHFEQWFPFEFITEYIAQVKLWFYSTLFMSVVLEDKAPWKNVLATGFVVDEKGEPMHKSKGNAIWFNEGVERMGADAMRWLYISAPASRDATDLRFGYAIAEEIKRRFFLILWNTVRFVLTYAQLDGQKTSSNLQLPISNLQLLDRWILSRLQNLIKEVTAALDNYNTPAATRALEQFVVADLSGWYIRRSRGRVGPTIKDSANKENFYATAFTVLSSLLSLLTPFVPFLTEWLWQYRERFSIKRPNSVHLEDWPQVVVELVDENLEEKMDLARRVVEKGHAVRKEARLRIRQPLERMAVLINDLPYQFEDELTRLITDELNIKKIVVGEEAGWLQQSSTGKTALEAGLSVVLETALDSSLILEGICREIARLIQDLRKEAGYELDDQILLFWHSDYPEIKKAFKEFDHWLKAETLAAEIQEGFKEKIDLGREFSFDGKVLWLGTQKV